MNNDRVIWLIIAGLLIATSAGAVYVGTRGLRNNNPGNIRHGNSQWVGMSPEQTDSEYVQFDDPVYGIRAMVKLLRNYQSRYGLNTIAGIIDRWAPPNENITGSYITHVAQVANVDPNAEIDINHYMIPVVETIIKHENGSNPYTREQVTRAIQLAG